MIQNVRCSGSFEKLYRWHSVSELKTPPDPEKHIRECRTLLHFVSKAIDLQCMKYRDHPEALGEIRNLFVMYDMLISHIRQAETERVRSRLDDESRSVSPEFISVTHYEHELIRDK